MTGERGEKNTSQRRASHRKQVFNKSKSCRTSSCWLAPRLRLTVFIGAFRRRKNLSVCVIRVVMPPKTPKGKLRFRRTKGEKKRTYSTHHRGSYYSSQNNTAPMRGIHNKKVRGRRQVPIAERLFQVLPRGQGLRPLMLILLVMSVLPSSSRVPRVNTTYRIVIHECENLRVR